MFRTALIVIVVLLVAVPAGLYAWSRIAPHTVRTEIEIDASPERVWQVLTDFRAYPEWNPFIVGAAGEARAGAKLTNRLSSKGSVMTFTPTVLVAEPARELRWLGRFHLPGLADGEHYFLIEPIGAGRSRLVQGERFTGVLVPVAGGALDVEDGFRAMNSALKLRAEKMGG